MDHQHWIPGIECPLPNCYTRFEIPGFQEVWGLNTYTQANELGISERSEFGELVHDLKYVNQPLSGSDERIQKLEKFTSTFIREMLPANLDFIITVPANRPNTVSIPKFVARNLRDRGHSRVFESLRLIAPVRTLKSIAILEDRLKEVLGAYELSQKFDEETSRNVLVLDDVIESGSTMRAASAAIYKKWPNAHVFGIAFTFVKDFKIKP